MTLADEACAINKENTVDVTEYWKQVRERVLTAARAERKLGRDPGSVSMYENVSFAHAGRIWSGEVRGIYAAHVKVLRGNGASQRVEYTQLVDQQ